MVGAATGAVLAVVRRQSMPVYVVGMFVNYGVFGGLFFSECRDANPRHALRRALLPHSACIERTGRGALRAALGM